MGWGCRYSSQNKCYACWVFQEWQWHVDTEGWEFQEWHVDIYTEGWVFQEWHVDMEGWVGVSGVICWYGGVGRCFRSDMLIWRGGQVFQEWHVDTEWWVFQEWHVDMEGWVFQEWHVDTEGWTGVSGVKWRDGWVFEEWPVDIKGWAGVSGATPYQAAAGFTRDPLSPPLQQHPVSHQTRHGPLPHPNQRRQLYRCHSSHWWPWQWLRHDVNKMPHSYKIVVHLIQWWLDLFV